jgi:hypothetical protein
MLCAGGVYAECCVQEVLMYNAVCRTCSCRMLCAEGAYIEGCLKEVHM